MKKQSKKAKNAKSKTDREKTVPALNLDFDIEPPRKKYDFSESQLSAAKPNSGNKYTKNEIRRKQNKKRRLKNNVRNVLITLGVLLAVSVIGTVLSLTVFFKITDINISGSGIYTQEQIEQVCEIETGGNLFLIDKEKNREKLTELLPYIYDVKFKRKLPGTLHIQIQDAVCAYSVLNDDGTYVLLDDNLKVLENAAKESPADATVISDVLIVGSNPGSLVEFENPDTLGCIKSIAEAIKAVGLNDISQIKSSDKNNNSLLYKNRIVLELGDCSNLESKLYKCLAACEELENKNGEVKGKLNISTGKQIYFTEE